VPHTVDSIAWLDTSLWVDRALAGVSYWIKLGPSRVRLTLPLENVDDAIQAAAASCASRRRTYPLRDKPRRPVAMPVLEPGGLYELGGLTAPVRVECWRVPTKCPIVESGGIIFL
jgi:hypothetical protein